MDLVTVQEVVKPSKDVQWREGDAWLAGGTWLYSEPQTHLRRMIDLESLGWEPLTITEEGLEIAATCKIVELVDFVAPTDWKATHLFRECANCFLMSFKIWNMATVGGNVCMSLPAGAMVSLTSGLEGICKIQSQDGAERKVSVVDFVTGNNHNVLQPGDLLRSITLPVSALKKRASFRRMSMTHWGRSTVLVIATVCPDTGAFVLTITAATDRPIQIKFDAIPSSADLTSAINASVPDSNWFDDVHGTPEYRKHMTNIYAEELRAELSEGRNS